jgi:hypothetical protein
MNQRAFSVLEVKGINEERRVITGLATSPVPDRAGDVVDPFGAKYAETIPLFLYHDSRLPVGTVKLGKPTAQGIPFEATLPKVTEAGALQSRVDEAWQMVKYKLIAAVSIGFREIAGKVKRLKDGGLEFLESEILELSLVPIPMQSLATITSIKSFDASTRTALGINSRRTEQQIALGASKNIDSASLAASGRKRSEVDPPPGASGSKQQPPQGGFFTSERKGNQVKTIAELRAERETKAARMGELMTMKKANDGTYDAAEREEFDGLSNELDALDDDIRELKFHSANSAGAREVRGATQNQGSQSRSRTAPTSFGQPDDAFPGQSFVRRCIAQALAGLNHSSKEHIAEQRWGKSHPQLVQWIKADVTGGGSGSGEWGAELVSADNRFTGDFITYLYSQTVFDSLPLRSVPAHVTIKGQDGVATANWVGESKPIPASAQDYSSVSLTPLKVAALSVVSNELLRDSSPSAEMLVRDALVEASAQKIDTHFFSTTAASNGVSPAGILNGVTVGATGGATEAELIGDIVGLTRPFITAKYRLANLVWVTNPLVAMQISLMRNALGQNAFPSMSAEGGTLEGRRVYQGHNVGTGDLILMSPMDIWKIGNGGVTVEVSREASIEQDDTPTGASDSPTGVSTKVVSMFQSESTAFKVVRSINWQKRRTGAVQYIGNASYGDINSV